VFSNEHWPMYAWAAAVAVAIVAGVWTATKVRETRPVLPREHIAGAALVGLFGWEMLVHLPGAAMGYWTLTAGMGDLRGDEAHQTYVAAQAVFVIGAGFAVVGILRRRTWGAVLGIGLAAAVVVMSGIGFIQTVAMFGEVIGDDAYFEVVAGVVAMRGVPALAAIALLAWPLVRRTTPRVDVAARDLPGVPVQAEPGR